MSNQAALEEALAYHHAGSLPETERLYEHIIASPPRQTGALVP